MFDFRSSKNLHDRFTGIEHKFFSQNSYPLEASLCLVSQRNFFRAQPKEKSFWGLKGGLPTPSQEA